MNYMIRCIGMYICLAAMCLAAPARAFVIDGTCWPSRVTIGVNAGDRFDLARNANIGWVRLTIRWRDVNPSPNVWTFGAVDGMINNAQQRGHKILAILSTAPSWAGGGPRGNVPPTDVSLWREFVRRTATRYAGKVAAYEIWNEPNLQNIDEVGVGWDRNLSSAPFYTDYLSSAAQEIRAKAPGTLVVAPGTSSVPNSRTVEIFRQIQAHGVSGSVDVVSFHANGTNRTVIEVTTAIDSQVSTLNNRNPANGNKPLWITEMGWRSLQVGEGGQRDRTKSVITKMVGFPCTGGENGWADRNFSHAFIFVLVDGPSESAGIYRSNLTAKPIVTDYIKPLGYPASAKNEFGHTPFSYQCSGRTCVFVSSFGDPLDLVDHWWAFGDGSGVVRGAPGVTHTFAKSGWYFVKQGVAFKGDGWPAGGGDFQLIKVP